jgi:hypothetical protein
VLALNVRDALSKIANRFAALADQREQKQFSGWAAGDE